MLNHVILNSPSQDLTFSTLIPREKNPKSAKVEKKQRMKIVTPEEIFIISTDLVPINIKTTKDLLRAPPGVTFPKGKSPNHPIILHVQVANDQVRIPQEKRGNIKMPVSSYHGDKLLWGTFKLKPDLDFRRFERENTHEE